METGILIIAFGARGYHYAAYNLCLSIKHYNKNIKVAIYCDSSKVVDYTRCGCDLIKEIKVTHEPGLNKINVLSDLPFENTLYLDADGICMKDIAPFIEDLKKQNKFFICDILGSGNYGEEIEYDLWAKHEDSFDFFTIDKTKKWHTTQTSWMFLKKGKELNDFVKQLKFYWNKGFKKEKLKSKWGKYMPDELFFSGIISKNEIDTKYSMRPIFYGTEYLSNLGVIKNNHYIMALHGNGIGRTLTKLDYWEYYDRLMFAICKEMGQSHIYKVHYLAGDKITNWT